VGGLYEDYQHVGEHVVLCIGSVVDFTRHGDNSGRGGEVAELHVPLRENAL